MTQGAADNHSLHKLPLHPPLTTPFAGGTALPPTTAQPPRQIHSSHSRNPYWCWRVGLRRERITPCFSSNWLATSAKECSPSASSAL